MTAESIFAQVCCPDFQLKDAVEICASDFACSSTSPAGGQGHSMVACKLSAHTYTVYPNTAPYTYTWTITGGTPVNPAGNPVTILWGPGTTGFIKVVINGGGCHDSIMQQICLIDGPKANFTIAPNPVCTGDLVYFTNTSSGGSGYLWDFGDGTTSTLATPPAHIYSVPGFYTVILTATDMGAPKQGSDIRTPCGCSDTISQVVHVLNGTGPSIETTCCYGTVCPGDTSSFCTPVVCVGYNWTVAGGSIISGAGTNCIKIKWNVPYTFPTTVSLSVPGCVAAPCPGTTTLQVPVLGPNIPISGPNPLCVGSSGSFFLPSMPGTYYQWTTTAPAGSYTFNDKNRNVANVNITFNAAGTYVIQCNYTNPLSGCSGTSVFTINVLPVFSISGSEKVCQGSTETYYGSGAANWAVTGPGVISPTPLTGSSTNITWTIPGMYTITATPTITGVYCNLSAVKVVQVVAVPIMGPIVGPTIVCPGNNITFSVSSNTTGSPFSWSVTGGGIVQTQFGNDRNTAIIKFSGGPTWTISVVQQIEISPGVFCSSLPQTLVVNKYGPSVISGSSPVCVDAVTNFTATGPTPILWSIIPSNRGTIVTGQGTGSVNIRWHGPPATATLIASSCGGSGSIPIVILNPPAKPVISANGPFYYCSPNLPPSAFTLSVPNIYSTYQWYGPSVPPGANSAAYTPVAGTFPGPGSYIFTVVVSNGLCSVSSSIQVLIGTCSGTGGPPPNPVPCNVDFSISPNPVCENQPATFTANTMPPGFNSGYTYQWAFGDGATSFQSPTQHSYLTAGTYSVTVTATFGTCVHDTVHQIMVKPTPVCNITVNDTMYCPGSFVTFTACTGQSSYQWYKDGLSISGANGSTCNAYQYGDYWVQVSNSYGCTNTSNHIFIYEKALPTAKITGNGLVCGYVGGLESFQLTAFYNANYSYSWSANPPGATFSPNNSNAGFVTNVSLTLPGTLPYTCSFIVKVTDITTGCEKRDTLCVTFYETPPLTFTVYSGCEGTPVTLAPATPPVNTTLYHYQWSNGKTTPSITVSLAGNYSLTIINKISGCQTTALAAMIHPKPDLSLFPRGCDSICHNDTLHLYIPLPLNALPPFNNYPATYPLIKWFDNGNYVTPIGTGQYLNFNTGVLGNHQISVVVGTVYGCNDTAGVFCLNVRHCDPFIGLDFGDAPDNPKSGANYQTLLPNGARHNIVAGVYLGAKVDQEPNGQPSVGADCDDNDCLYASLGDDEDGVAMPAVIEIGSTINITVQASVAGYLDAWIDYNIDGTWVGPGEHIFTGQTLVTGANAISFIVPATAAMGQSYARFRFRTTSPPISYNGLVSDGEVEDYPVFIDECSQGTELDFGDAPDAPQPVGLSYPTLLSNNGARHFKYLNIRLGALIDAETDGQPNTLSTGDDIALSDDEDGVQFIGQMYVGRPANIQVTASIAGFLNAWMDYNQDGDWADPGEKIFANQPLAAGVNNLSFNIPATAQQGKIYSRFRFNTIGGLNYFGLALNGEVEDYRVHACPYWWPVHTNLKHYITIPHNLKNLNPGDVLGVFYQDAAGMPVCGGLSEFNGMDDQMMIAYGDDPSTPIKDGFNIGEPIVWKLCSIIKGDANTVDVIYDFTSPSHNGLFTLNGLSALSEINGLNVTAIASPGTICAGDATQLHADVSVADGVAFTWTSLPAGFNSDHQNPVANPSGNTTYYVQAFDGVFHAYDTVIVTVTQVNPLVEMLPLNNIVIPINQSNCYNATQTITVAGNGTTFILQRGGSVQMVAGKKINFLPGTSLILGSYLHAYISTNGTYCCSNILPVPAIMTGESTANQPDVAKPFFKVYPNPTTGTFTLELNGVAETSQVSVEIYGILGERILKTEIQGSNQHIFDLSDRQHGVYLVRVINGNERGLTKIIKQ